MVSRNYDLSQTPSDSILIFPDVPASPPAAGSFLGAVTSSTKLAQLGFFAPGAVYIPIAGGTMTGPLILWRDPQSAMEAVTKQYSDLKLPLAGGQMTGFVSLAGDGTQPLHATTLQQLNTKLNLSGGTMTGLVQLSGDPSLSLHAATKQYVDVRDIAVTAGYLPLAGGTMTGALNIMSAGVLSGTADTRNPGVLMFTDATGNVGSYVALDGTWQFATYRANTGTITTLNATTGTFTSFTAGAGTITNFSTPSLSVTGGDSTLDALTIRNGGRFTADARNPSVAFTYTDSVNAIGGLFVQVDGSVRMGTAYIVNANVTTLTAATYAPAALTFGQASTSPADQRNRYAQAWTDTTDQGSMMLTATGSLAFSPASGVLSKHTQTHIERSHMMTQGPPEHSGSANTPGVSGTTYHMIATLDCNGFDAVRLIIPSMNTPAGATITACIAPTANPTDRLNPKDAAGSPVPWRPVTFGSAGASVDWEDQPDGTITLTTNTVSPVGTSIINVANTTGAQVGMVVVQYYPSAFGLSLKDNYAIVTAVGTTTLTIDRAIQNFDIPNATSIYLTPNQLVLPAWGGYNSNESVKLVTSDWMPLSSLDRSDGGRWPLLMVRVYATGGAHTSLVTPDFASNWLGLLDDRIWSNYTQLGDFVSTNQGIFTSGTENGTMIVGWLQFYSRARGCTVQFVGDSITQGINNGSLSGIGALQQTAWMLSSPTCPVTNVGMVNGWNASGVGTGTHQQALRHMDVFKPPVMVIESWSRNGEFNKPPNAPNFPDYAMETANYYWQQCMRLATKLRRRYRGQAFYYPMPPSDAVHFTAVTDAVRKSAITRAKQAADGGEMYYDPDALMGTGSTPVNDTKYPGLHPPADAQMLIAYDVARQLKSGLGIAP